MWWILMASGIGLTALAGCGIARLARQLPDRNEDFDALALGSEPGTR